MSGPAPTPPPESRNQEWYVRLASVFGYSRPSTDKDKKMPVIVRDSLKIPDLKKQEPIRAIVKVSTSIRDQVTHSVLSTKAYLFPSTDEKWEQLQQEFHAAYTSLKEENGKLDKLNKQTSNAEKFKSPISELADANENFTDVKNKMIRFAMKTWLASRETIVNADPEIWRSIDTELNHGGSLEGAKKKLREAIKLAPPEKQVDLQKLEKHIDRIFSFHSLAINSGEEIQSPLDPKVLAETKIRVRHNPGSTHAVDKLLLLTPDTHIYDVGATLEHVIDENVTKYLSVNPPIQAAGVTLIKTQFERGVPSPEQLPALHMIKEAYEWLSDKDSFLKQKLNFMLSPEMNPKDIDRDILQALLPGVSVETLNGVMSWIETQQSKSR